MGRPNTELLNSQRNSITKMAHSMGDAGVSQPTANPAPVLPPPAVLYGMSMTLLADVTASGLGPELVYQECGIRNVEVKPLRAAVWP